MVEITIRYVSQSANLLVLRVNLQNFPWCMILQKLNYLATLKGHYQLVSVVIAREQLKWADTLLDRSERLPYEFAIVYLVKANIALYSYYKLGLLMETHSMHICFRRCQGETSWVQCNLTNVWCSGRDRNLWPTARESVIFIWQQELLRCLWLVGES